MSISPAKAEISRAGAFMSLARRYPVAALALAGILAGVLLLPLGGNAARWVFLSVVIGGGLPLTWSTLRNILRGRFTVDLIATLAIVGAGLQGEYLAGALVVLMQSGGEALDDYGLRRANQSLERLLQRAPSTALRKEDGEYREVPASALRTGDLVLVRPGAIIAADGVVVEGQGSVDEAALTGEPVPLAKAPGDQVFSGTINLDGSFLVRATSTAAASKYELIVRMVQQAQGERAPIQRLADRYTLPFTLLTLTSAGLLWLALHDPVRALAVLVVATPCPLLIATPVAVLSAVNRAAALNIIVKSGAAIEQAASVRSVLFDKTGTLTVGEPLVSEVRGYGPWRDAPDDLLAGAAAVELLSSHVLARAVLAAARERGLVISPAAEVREAPGTGVAGMVAGRRFALGSGGFLRSQGAEVPEARRQERAAASADGNSVAYVAVNSELAGLLVFSDQLRPEAPQLMRRLADLGLKRVLMLTGDAAETARGVAQTVGIAEFRARLQPEEKLEIVRALDAEAPAMMVGDGINDAPALAAATVGVAMGHFGAGIATDAADVVITVENVERVADVIAIGRRMVRVAKQGIFFGMGASVVLMVLAALGHIPPTAGALLQELLDLAAILNALRAR